MKHLALALLVACLASPALAGSKRSTTKVIDGKAVTVKRPLRSKPLVDVLKLRFYDCILDNGRVPCTVVRGEVLSHLPTADFAVTLTFAFHDKHLRRGTFPQMGSATVEVVRPEPGKPTPFTALGPDCIRNRDASPVPATFTGYTLSLQVKPFKPKRDF